MYNLIILIVCLLVSVELGAGVKYSVDCPMELLLTSRIIAYQQVGVSNNDSAMIKEYLASVRLKYPNPYCAAGQYYCFLKAMRITKFNTIPIFRTGSAQLMFHRSKINGVKFKYSAEIDDLKSSKLERSRRKGNRNPPKWLG